MKEETKIMTAVWFLCVAVSFAGLMLLHIHRTKEKNFWSRLEKDRCIFMLRQPRYFPNDQERCREVLK